MTYRYANGAYLIRRSTAVAARAVIARTVIARTVVARAVIARTVIARTAAGQLCNAPCLLFAAIFTSPCPDTCRRGCGLCGCRPRNPQRCS